MSMMHRVLAPVTIATSLMLSGAALAEEKPSFADMDVFDLEWATNPALSPDGKTVAYQRNAMDVMTDSRQSRIWLVNADGSEHVKLTARDVNEGGAVWSPDGSRLAFTSQGANGAEIFVYWLASGKVARLTELARSPSGLSWSPDGTQLAFSMLVPEEAPVLVKMPKKPKGAKWADDARVTTRLKYEQDGQGYLETGFAHLFVVPADGGTARKITSGNFHHTGTPQWSGDAQWLVFSANRHADFEHDYANSEIYRVSLNSGEIEPLTDRVGPDYNPAISPDGKQIAYLGYDDKIQTYQVPHLYLMNLDGSDKKSVPLSLDRNISDIKWRKSGIFFQYDNHGNSKVAVTSLTGKVTTLADDLGGSSIGRPYGGGDYTVNAAGQIAYTHTTPYRPADVAFLNRGQKKPDLVTGLNEDLLAHRTLGKVKTLWYKSTVDQRDLQGWVVLPPDYQPGNTYPLLVENHGGPTANYGDRFSAEIQLYAAAGYVVFYPNARGSTSYGEEFGNLLFNHYPGDDYQDVMDGVDTLIAQGYTREDQLYVTGGSAGGIMTAWMIGQNNRFEAAAVVKPVMNWISKTLVADNYYAYANYRYPGQPWENVENYWKFSPISRVGYIQTPTLVMVGDADMRTPLSEAKQLYNALKIRKIDTALVEMPGAYHLIAKRPSQMISKVKHVLAWFEQHSTQPQPAPAQP